MENDKCSKMVSIINLPLHSSSSNCISASSEFLVWMYLALQNKEESKSGNVSYPCGNSSSMYVKLRVAPSKLFSPNRFAHKYFFQA